MLMVGSQPQIRLPKFLSKTRAELRSMRVYYISIFLLNTFCFILYLTVYKRMCEKKVPHVKSKAIVCRFHYFIHYIVSMKAMNMSHVKCHTKLSNHLFTIH